MKVNNEAMPQSAVRPADRELGDFSTDFRVLVLVAISCAIGVLSTLAAKALLALIAVVTNAAYYQRFSTVYHSPEFNRLGWWAVAIPVAGGLIVGLMARFGSEKIRGHGIPEALEAILIGRSRIGLRVAILKPLSSAVAIGTGGPFGAEGPIIMTGGAIGSLVAQLFHLSPAERKVLLVAGAAGGMSAIFGTPVAAVLLAVELLLFEWKPRSLIPVAVSSVAAYIARAGLMPHAPLFPVAAHGMLGGASIAIGAALGILCGAASGLLTFLVYLFEDLFRKLTIHWMYWPVIGGLAVGLVGLWQPAVLGVGYGTIHALLLGKIAGAGLIAFFVAKALVWSFSLGSGTSGGVLAPLLMLGGAIGAYVALWIPGHDAGLWALVGMTAMMAGTMRAPFTGVVFGLEVTHDFNALPVVFAASVTALSFTVLLLKRSILTEKVARRGLHVNREYAVDPYELTRVGEVMDEPVVAVASSLTVSELARQVADHRSPTARHHAVAIIDGRGALCGIITRGDMLRSFARFPDGSESVAAAGSAHVHAAYPDELVGDALGRMLDLGIGRLLVVDRDDHGKLVGYLGRPGILSAHRQRLEEETRIEPGSLAGVARFLSGRTGA